MRFYIIEGLLSLLLLTALLYFRMECLREVHSVLERAALDREIGDLRKALRTGRSEWFYLNGSPREVWGVRIVPRVAVEG